MVAIKVSGDRDHEAAAIAGALVAKGVPTDAIEVVSGDDPGFVGTTPPAAAKPGARRADLIVERK